MYKQKTNEREPDSFLKELWQKYDFPGNSPLNGSVSESRLKQACQDYANVVNNLRSSYMYKGNSENYVSPTKTVKKVSSFDSRRREIHNQITLMVVGKQRLGMTMSLAERIADFALEYAENL